MRLKGCLRAAFFIAVFYEFSTQCVEKLKITIFGNYNAIFEKKSQIIVYKLKNLSIIKLIKEICMM